MLQRFKPLRWVALGLAPVLALAACGGGTAGASGECNGLPETPVISFAAYSTPREVYGKIIPAFTTKWKDEHDEQTVIFQESYGGVDEPGGQRRRRLRGRHRRPLARAGRRRDRRRRPDHARLDRPARRRDGLDLVVVFDVRPGNPLGIQDWDDLAASGVEVLTPDPASSGGARWNLVSAWGSALRGHAGVQADDEAGATSLMQGVLGNVVTFDKSARDSIKNFESGNGDVAITYENEVLTAQEAGPRGRGRLPAVVRPDREPGRDRRPERRQALRPRGRRGVRRVPPQRRGEGALHRRRVPAVHRPRGREGRRSGERVPRDRGPVDRRGPRRLGRAERGAVQRRRRRDRRRWPADERRRADPRARRSATVLVEGPHRRRAASPGVCAAPRSSTWARSSSIPVAAVISQGFGDGLGAFRAAMAIPNAWHAIGSP